MGDCVSGYRLDQVGVFIASLPADCGGRLSQAATAHFRAVCKSKQFIR